MGINVISSALTASETSIIRRGPRTVAAWPPHRPSRARPMNSAASTAPIRAGEPVETSTNHGSAIAVSSVPVVETMSAASRPNRARFRLTGENLPFADRQRFEFRYRLIIDLDQFGTAA